LQNGGGILTISRAIGFEEKILARFDKGRLCSLDERLACDK